MSEAPVLAALARLEDSQEDPKLAELERLLNDPDVPIHAARVWELLAEISGESDPASYSRHSPGQLRPRRPRKLGTVPGDYSGAGPGKPGEASAAGPIVSDAQAPDPGRPRPIPPPPKPGYPERAPPEQDDPEDPEQDKPPVPPWRNAVALGS